LYLASGKRAFALREQKITFGEMCFGGVRHPDLLRGLQLQPLDCDVGRPLA
jgi:hypothetical protein